MSGDHGLRIAVPASLQALQHNPHIHLHLVGDTEALKLALARYPDAELARIQLVPAQSVIPMDAKASRILRGNSDSSMHVALDLLAQGSVSAVVSAGNTGALMALSRRAINMLHGFSRPAFCSAIPVREGSCYMLDLGANVDCNADNLHEFALMGTALVTALENKHQPRVVLLSNGTESNKGNAVIKIAGERLMADDRINFCGFLEGSALHDGDADLVVCDGLLGNVALKVAEATAALASTLIAREYDRHWWSRALALLSAPVLRGLKRSLSADLHGGAFLLGLQGVVVKSHGGSSAAGFAAAIGQAALCIEHEMVAQLRRYTDEQNLVSEEKIHDVE
jgi:glycerol-3-phosphate acyltransferase PlsX